MDPETRHGVIVVALFAFGILSALALLDIAGVAGEVLDRALRTTFGVAVYATPLLSLALAASLVREERKPFTIIQGVGLVLLVCSLTGLLELRGGAAPSTALPEIVERGGYLGLVLATPLLRLFGPLAATVVLAATTLIGIFVGFHLSFIHVRAITRGIAAGIAHVRISLLAARYRARTTEDSREPDEPEFRSRTLREEEDADRAEADAVDEDANSDAKEPGQPSPADALAAPARARRRRPKIDIPVNLLSGEIGKPTSGDIRLAQEIIRKTLLDFRIPVEMGGVQVGPTVTQFTLRPAEGVKLSRITALSSDLALALASHPIRIEAPIPGRSLVGIEVPNQKVAVVRLREILESDAFTKRKSDLTVALGKDVAGDVWTADVASMPHLLVAGATGSGKSVCLNAIIVSLLYENGPDDLRLLLVDPKRVEFPVFNGIPHLLTPVVTDVRKTVNALKWAIAEMDRRFALLASRGKRNLASYNRSHRAEDRLPVLVIVIDELADLMAVAANEVEAAIIRIAQMARAVGIHLIVATQRPSVDVITGLIKANITSRIAFAVASSTDSRTILDQVGAERLLGRGDMLYTCAELSKPKRIQGAFVADDEIQRIVEHLRERGEAEYADVVTEQPTVAFTDGSGDGSGDEDGADDPLLPDAKEVLLQAGKGSASLLQRRLKIGYARAARILDILEAQGFIGPAEGAKPRRVFGEQERGRGPEPGQVREREPVGAPEDDNAVEDEYDGDSGSDSEGTDRPARPSPFSS